MEKVEQGQVSPEKKSISVIIGEIGYILDHYLDQEGHLIESELTQGATLRDQLEKIKQELKRIG